MHIIQKIIFLEVYMYFIKNKLFYWSIIVFLLFFVFSHVCLATDNTSFVWSEISNPSIQTVSSLTEGKR